MSPYQIPVGEEKEQFPGKIRRVWVVHSHPALPVLPEGENTGREQDRAVQGLFLSAVTSAVAAMPGASSWLESLISLHSVPIIHV